MFLEGTSDAGIESLHPTHNIGQAFEVWPIKAGRSSLQLQRTRNDRSVARSQLKPWGPKMQPNTSAPRENDGEQRPTPRKGLREVGDR